MTNNNDEILKELVEVINSGNLFEATDKKLEEYMRVLSAFGSTSSKYFTPVQFPQVCENVRLLLFKKYTEKIDKQNEIMQTENIELQRQNNALQRLNVKLQRIVIVLMVVTILTAAVQIGAALKPNSQLQQQSELLKDIQSNSSGIQKSLHNLLGDGEK